VIERFRRRLAVSEASIARFIIGGHQEDDGDRLSGIMEEAVLSLALRRPIYVAGAFGGAARDLGALLGLDRVRSGEVPERLKKALTVPKRDWLLDIRDRLRPPPLTNLPVLPDEQVTYLREHAMGGPGWPDNKLNLDENRTLFHSDKPDEVADLVTRGLLRLVDSGQRRPLRACCSSG
jgi:hypothetical protein